MKGFRISVFFLVLASIFILVFAQPTFAAYASPFQIRMVMFRVLDFFNDTVDSALPQSPGGNGQPAPTQAPPQSPNPPPPSGACPFQAVTTIRECIDASCTQTQPISDFDNNQQYGAANDLRIVNNGDAPDANFPFGHAGRPGEIIIATGDQPFPTADGYQRGDPVDIKVYLDANKDGVIDNGWELVAKQCENFGTASGCPDSQQKYNSTNAPLGEIQNMVVDCGLNVRYGWLLKKSGSSAPTQTQQPTNSPTGASQPTQQAQPTSQAQPTNVAPTSSSGSTDQMIQSVLRAISEQSIQTNLTSLVDDDDTAGADETQTRYSGSSGNEREATFARDFFQNLGLTTELQPFTFGNTSTNNVVATLPGTKTDEFYLITAHLDSTGQASGSTDPAPGADDNGSGTVMVMEAAKALKQAGISPNVSIRFILFSGEEQGLNGSIHYVRTLPSSDKVKGVINVDMIGNRSSGDCVNFNYKPYNGGNILSEAAVAANQTYNLGLTTSSRASSEGRSDHKPFWDAGIPAIFGHECTFSPVYHTVNDKLDKINFTQITKTAKAVAAAIALLALQ